MIENLKNANVITDPWEHIVIDNFLPVDIFNDISNAAKLLSPHVKKGHWRGIFLREAELLGVQKQTINTIINLTDTILDNIEDITKPFSHFNKSTSGYACMPKIAITSSGCQYPIHTDSCLKVLTLLVYVYPDNNVGTALYRTKNKNDYVQTIEWQPNRCFIFCPYDNKDTWHSWANMDKTDNRVTLKFEIEKVEDIGKDISIEERSQFDIEDMVWLYDQFGNSHLTSNK